MPISDVVPRIKDIEVINLPNENDVGMLIVSERGNTNVSLDGPEVASLITSLTARLMERQNPEALQLLQIFAIRSIEAGQTPEGRPYLLYKLENGLAFSTGITRAEVTSLHAGLGAILGNWP